MGMIGFGIQFNVGSLPGSVYVNQSLMSRFSQLSNDFVYICLLSSRGTNAGCVGDDIQRSVHTIVWPTCGAHVRHDTHHVYDSRNRHHDVYRYIDTISL